MRLGRLLITIMILLVAATGLSLLRANAETQTGDIGVGMTVPSTGAVCGNDICESGEDCSTCAGDCGGCPQSVDSNPPVISNVLATANIATATITWTAVDDRGVQDCNLSYSIDEMYDTFGTVARSGNDFRSDLSGLTSSTIYHFRIYCFDARNNNDTYLGIFSTIGAQAQVNLTVLAQPEKRVEKPGGNLAVSSTLIIYHPLAGQVLGDLDISLSANGQGVFNNALLPSGENLWAILKGDAHLAKKIIGVNIVNGQDVTLDFTDAGAFYLKAGDAAGDVTVAADIPNAFLAVLSNLHRDDFVDILDISAVVSRFNQSSGFANLNGDSIVDAQDISMVLSNWNAKGDIVLE